MIGRAIIRLANWIIGSGKRPKPITLELESCEAFVCEVTSPFLHNDDAFEARTRAAMSMTDDDTYGYILMVLKKPEAASATGEVGVHGYVQDEWWPAFAEMADRVHSVATGSFSKR